MSIPPARRAAIAGVSLVLATVLFHAQIASALVTRGDDRLRAADIDGAVRAYERALRFDPASPAATDRLAFYLLLRRRNGDATRAYDVASSGLRRAPRDANLFVDRGLAAQRMRHWSDAARDFARAAEIAHDVRYARLAKRLAARGRDA